MDANIATKHKLKKKKPQGPLGKTEPEAGHNQRTWHQDFGLLYCRFSVVSARFYFFDLRICEGLEVNSSPTQKRLSGIFTRFDLSATRVIFVFVGLYAKKKKVLQGWILAKASIGVGTKTWNFTFAFSRIELCWGQSSPVLSDLLTKFQGDACNRPRRNQVNVAKKNMRSSPLRFWRLSKQNASFDIWNATIPDWVPCWLNVANYWHKGRKEKKNIQDLSWLFGKWKGKMWQKPFFISWWLHWAPKEKLLFISLFFLGALRTPAFKAEHAAAN